MTTALMAALVLAQTPAIPAELAASPHERVLVELVQQRRAGKAPRVTVVLDGGVRLTGEVLDLANEDLLLVNGADTIHVRPSSIVAVEVAGGASLVPAPAPLRTKSEVQRAVEEQGRVIAEALGRNSMRFDVQWKALAENAPALALIEAAAIEAASALRVEAADAARRQDIGRRLTRVQIVAAHRASATLTGDTLVIEVASDGGPRGRPSAAEIRAALR